MARQWLVRLHERWTSFPQGCVPDGVLKLWILPLIRKELAELGLDW
jgi:hypothetical protein